MSAGLTKIKIELNNNLRGFGAQANDFFGLDNPS